MLQNEIKNCLVRYIRKQYGTFATSDQLALKPRFLRFQGIGSCTLVHS